MGRRAEGWKLTELEGGLYGVRFTVGGRRYHRSTGERTKTKAAKEAARIYAKAVRGELAPTRASLAASPLGELITRWLVDVKASRSEGYHAKLEGYSVRWLQRWNSLADVDPQRYIRDRLGEGISPVTLHKELVGLRRFFKWCVRRGHLTEVPTWDAPKPHSDYEAACLTPKQVAAILAKLPDRKTHRKGYPVREWYTVMWETAFRRGTLARLTWGNVDLDGKTIKVSASADKARYKRAVPLSDAAVEALRGLGKGKADELVFGPRDFRASLCAAGEAAKVPGGDRLHDHVIRHSRITDWASRTTNVAALQYLAGHRTLITTMRYLHPRLDEARELVESGNSGQVSGQKRSARKKPTAKKRKQSK